MTEVRRAGAGTLVSIEPVPRDLMAADQEIWCEGIYGLANGNGHHRHWRVFASGLGVLSLLEEVESPSLTRQVFFGRFFYYAFKNTVKIGYAVKARIISNARNSIAILFG